MPRWRARRWTTPSPFGTKTISVRWMRQHLVEEYARHNGHADLLREAIDGSDRHLSRAVRHGYDGKPTSLQRT